MGQQLARRVHHPHPAGLLGHEDPAVGHPRHGGRAAHARDASSPRRSPRASPWRSRQARARRRRKGPGGWLPGVCRRPGGGRESLMKISGSARLALLRRRPVDQRTLGSGSSPRCARSIDHSPAACWPARSWCVPLAWAPFGGRPGPGGGRRGGHRVRAFRSRLQPRCGRFRAPLPPARRVGPVRGPGAGRGAGAGRPPVRERHAEPVQPGVRRHVGQGEADHPAGAGQPRLRRPRRRRPGLLRLLQRRRQPESARPATARRAGTASTWARGT